MLVVYNGIFDAVQLSADGTVCAKGEPVEVPDDLGAMLCAQDFIPGDPAPSRKK